MNDNRRDFLKRISIAGAATIALPGLLNAENHRTKETADAAMSKTFLFQAIQLPMAGAALIRTGTMYLVRGTHTSSPAGLVMIIPSGIINFFNRGISGNKVSDLAARWQVDTLDIKPDLLSILVGVNDVFGVIVRGEAFTADDFGSTYDALLDKTTRALPNVELVICEPLYFACRYGKGKTRHVEC